jgi:hypothetical protein
MTFSTHPEACDMHLYGYFCVDKEKDFSLLEIVFKMRMLVPQSAGRTFIQI